MAQLILNKKEFLLNAPLEVLHEESLEFLQEIEFWKDEVAFFYKLLMQKEKLHPEALKSPSAKEIEKHLINVSVDKLDELRLEVQSHEKFLARIMDDPKLDEQLYLSRHKILVNKFHEFEKEFKEMKSKIFKLVEEVKPVFRK